MNTITTKIWGETETIFLPTHLEHDQTYSHNPINIDHFCASAVSPVEVELWSPSEVAGDPPLEVGGDTPYEVGVCIGLVVL